MRGITVAGPQRRSGVTSMCTPPEGETGAGVRGTPSRRRSRFGPASGRRRIPRGVVLVGLLLASLFAGLPAVGRPLEIPPQCAPDFSACSPRSWASCCSASASGSDTCGRWTSPCRWAVHRAAERHDKEAAVWRRRRPAPATRVGPPVASGRPDRRPGRTSPFCPGSGG